MRKLKPKKWSTMYKFPILIVSFVSLIFSASAQKDTAFWFAIPYVSQYSGQSGIYSPAYFRISAFGNPVMVSVYNAATGTLIFPAQSIPANGTWTTPDISSLGLETFPPDQILNKGIHIVSVGGDIEAYYDVAASLNSQIFSLKGSNALGMCFWIPGQNSDANGSMYSPTPYNSFDIIATENNTVIQITPSNNITNHSANTPFTITLNRGQTYSATATSQAAANHLNGSRVQVVSGGSIAITVKDDLLSAASFGGGSHYDLCGDQTIPDSKIGTEYIVMRGDLYSSSTTSIPDKLFILATQPNTNIIQDGVTIATGVNAGITTMLSLVSNVSYIQTNYPVYVWQQTGVQYELSGSILPPIGYTGSDSVAFIRSSNDLLDIMLLVQASGINGFSLSVNGTPVSGIITGGNFTAVPGTSGQWYYAKININTSTAQAGNAVVISNSTNLFQMGLVNVTGGVGGGGCSGYFSDFGASVGTASNEVVCHTLHLHTDSLAGAVYSWTGPNGFSSNIANPIRNNITNQDTGVYSLTIAYGNCATTSAITVVSLNVDTAPPPSFFLGNDTSVCAAPLITLNSGISNTIWSTGEIGSTISVSNSGIYWAQDSNICGSFRDSIRVLFGVIEPFYLGNDTTYCGSFTRILRVNTTDSVVWSTGQHSTFITVNNPGLYWAEVRNQCGTIRDSIFLFQNLTPDVKIGNDTILCLGNTLTLFDTITNANYLWNTNATSNSINVMTGGLYWLRVTKNGCVGSDSIMIEYIAPPGSINIGNDTTYCGSFSRVLQVNTIDNVLWSTNQTSNGIVVSVPGDYFVRVYNECGETFDSILISQKPIPSVNLGNDIKSCYGTSITLDATAINATYLWQDNSIDATIIADTSGIYSVTVTVNGCSAYDSISVVFVYPIKDTLIDTAKCINDALQIGLASPYASYHWNTGEIDAVMLVRSFGEYYQTVTNACGEGVIIYDVAEKDCSCHVLFPTAFSPNGDGKNDNFGATYRCQLSNFQLLIFNRWGELVFSTTDIDERWDGFYKDRPQPLDVFTFLYQYTDLQTNKKHAGSGNVTLVK